jgi:hypothetical protein
MIFKCNLCYKNDPCILNFKKIGDFLPTKCPFSLICAEWKKVRKEKNNDHK